MEPSAIAEMPASDDVADLIRDPIFALAVQNQIDALSYSKRSALLPVDDGSSRQALAARLQRAALAMVTRSSALVAEMGTADDLHGLLIAKGVARDARAHNKECLEAVVAEQITDEASDGLDKQRSHLVGELRRVLGAALHHVDRARQRPKYRRAWANLYHLQGLPVTFLSEADTAKLAVTDAACSQQAVDYLTQLEAMPKIAEPAGGGAEQPRRRLQRKLALYPARHGRAIGARDREVAAILGEMFCSDELHIQPFAIDNTTALITQLHNILQRGKARLVGTSCPDYSGTVNEHGIWVCDFRELNAGPGFVATRGMPFIRHVHRILRERGVEVSFLHFEPSFEVDAGFRGVDGFLTPEQALGRLRDSGLAVVAELEAHGVRASGVLTGDLISDDAFAAKRAALAADFAARRHQPKVAAVMDKVLRHRNALYRVWFPPNEGEPEEAYRHRMLNDIIPQQLADHAIVGELMMQSGPSENLILAYDSPFMCEVHALAGLPAIFGRLKSMEYDGAAELSPS
ncbi:MAG: hypothetical protein Tsb0020_21150 [Haliangiales bacterium]